MACLTSMIEPLRAANEIAGKDAFAWVLVSEDGHKVQASANVAFEPDLALADCDNLEQLFLLSGPSPRSSCDRRCHHVGQKAINRLWCCGCV